ncbi:hypothetical protein [Pantoea sp. BAV 3049]|uniref:hypothetical protein n=1 Tax=Pantoea sp. BAV 3049 TaxID=2654188 RepID=UPI00131AEBF9|nr:hypothetical protein [Pantoea sp. BAV 3049]
MDNDEKIELLTRAGETAYGQNWKSELARFMGINDRSVRQWAAGERRIPASVIRGMVSHLRDRAALMNSETDRLVRDMHYDRDPEFTALKVLFLPNRRPSTDRLGNDAYKFLCFDVDGFIYCIDSNDRVINMHGDDTVLKNATVAELRAAYDLYINDPANLVD